MKQEQHPIAIRWQEAIQVFLDTQEQISQPKRELKEVEEYLSVGVHLHMF